VIAAWRMLDDAGHVALVERFLAEAGNWTDIEALDRSPAGGDPLFAVTALGAGSADKS
jgi:hypothetical protein